MSNFASALHSLGKESKDTSELVKPATTSPLIENQGQLPDPLAPKEFVLSNDQIRQAGADDYTHSFIADYKKQCEQHLYLFAYSILGLDLLTPTLHKPVTEWLTAFPPIVPDRKRRKLLLLPRDHLKTSVGSRGLPLHVIIQPPGDNIYFPGCQNKVCQTKRKETQAPCHNDNHFMAGSLSRMLLSSETVELASLQMGWCALHLSGNQTLRHLWPEVCWDRPRAESQSWNKNEITVRRPKAYPEPTIDTVGVGGAIAGRHYDIIIKDDLVTLNAANSPTIMERAREWHIAARALFHDQEDGIEIVLGTRWLPGDIYTDMLTDETMECMVRSIQERGRDGKLHSIFPEMFPDHAVERMKTEYGSLFPLIYMNDPSDPSLADFDTALLRSFFYGDGKLSFEADWRDDALMDRLKNANKPFSDVLTGDSTLLENLMNAQGNLRLHVHR